MLRSLALLAIGTAIFGFISVLIAKRHRRCPRCAATMGVFAAPADASAAYELWVCPSCPAVVTATNGQRSTLSWCPACRNRSLQTAAERLADEGGVVRVVVHEMCHLCGWDEDRPFQGLAPPRGLVVDFRAAAARRGRTPPD